MKYLALLLMLVAPLFTQAQETQSLRVEPPSWWTGFKNPEVQLLVHGKGITETTVSVSYPGFTIKKINKVKNPDYLFIDMTMAAGTKPGIATFQFRSTDGTTRKYAFEIKARRAGSASRKSFTSDDVIYLITPDRFANGDTTNDVVAGMTEGVDRTKKDSRHGGDIRGIIDHLDYISDLGATALWVNPLQENNQPTYSYHGYSITDYYKTDPRYGTNEDYLKLSDACHKRGMKLIMDQVFNHCGSMHWWMNDLPSPDWINEWPEYTRSTYRAGSVNDPYVSQREADQFVKGWFDKTMPDLNQHNPFLKNYLIQHSIWWMEFANLDGIRQDTHPYPFKDMMAEWGKRMLQEYPNLNIVGECWMNFPASVAYWQKDALNRDKYNSWLPSVFDFPLYNALNKAFNEEETWETGIVRLYDILAQDLSYTNPSNLVVFADNHDVNRYLDTQHDDVRKLKMAMAFILTTRGIPEIFYGTEFLLTTHGDNSHGTLRRDVPGGWPGDSVNLFTEAGRNDAENDMFAYMKNLLNWRKINTAVRTGNLKHFIPHDGIYVYFRYDSNGTVMVVLNNKEDERTIGTGPYYEFLKDARTGREVISGKFLNDLTRLTIAGKSVMVIEIRR